MKITLKNSQDTVELVQAMASKDALVRMEARQAFAEFMGKVMAEAMSNAVTIGNLYSTLSFRGDTSPTIPLDLYADITDVGYLNVWSQHQAGGLGTNEVRPTQQEMYVDTYNINSAKDAQTFLGGKGNDSFVINANNIFDCFIGACSSVCTYIYTVFK